MAGDVPSKKCSKLRCRLTCCVTICGCLCLVILAIAIGVAIREILVYLGQRFSQPTQNIHLSPYETQLVSDIPYLHCQSVSLSASSRSNMYLLDRAPPLSGYRPLIFNKIRKKSWIFVVPDLSLCKVSHHCKSMCTRI